MAAYTFLQAKAFLEDSNRIDNSAKGERNYLRIANQALGWMHTARRWLHMRKRGSVQFAAPYLTGTVAITAGAAVVTPTTGAFTAVMVGRFILFGGVPRPYEILSVDLTGGTTATLTENYHGETDFSGTFQVVEFSKALPSDFLELESPAVGSITYQLRPTLNLSSIMLLERWTNYLGIPQEYAVERTLTAAKLWVWPVPGSVQDLTFWYYITATPIATTSDSFAFPDVQGVQGMIEAFLAAALDDFNKVDATANKQTAMGLLQRVAATLEPVGELGGRTPYGMMGRRSYRGLYAPGIKDN